MLISFYSLVICFVFSSNCTAQSIRQRGVCDSTFYILNNDTTVIVGPNKIYLNTPNGIVFQSDFITTKPNHYIIDFDIIRPNLWYTLVGSSYWSNTTKLYKSTNRGSTWNLDTSFFLATNLPLDDTLYYNSINTFQKIGIDTIVLFFGYYHSGVVYSTNAGQTWKHWFDNWASNYQGLFFCQNTAYLYGLLGDGFSTMMFSFDKNNLFRNDSLVNFNQLGGPASLHPPCSQGGFNSPCNYLPEVAPFNHCDIYYRYKNYVDSTCSSVITSNIKPLSNSIQATIFPNPTNEGFVIKTNERLFGQVSVEIYNGFGKRVYDFFIHDASEPLNHTVEIKLNPSVYFVIIKNNSKSIYTNKLLIE